MKRKKIFKLFNVFTICMLLVLVNMGSITINAKSKKDDSVDNESERAGTNGTESDNDVKKHFYTITTTEGITYYLVVDDSQGSNNVYFLKEVNNSDLSALAGEEQEIEKDSSGNILDSIKNQVKERPEEPEKETITEPLETGQPPAPEQLPEIQKNKKKAKGIKVQTILYLVAGAGVAFYYFVIRKRKEPMSKEKITEFDETKQSDDEFEVDDVDDEIVL